MRPDEFYIDHEDPVFGGTSRLLNIDLITALRARPVEGRGDVEVAAGLAWLVHDDLERFGTGGGEGMPEPQMREAILALRAVVGRVGITDFNPPFRDYSTFKNHWLRNNCRHSYQARRNLLNDLFDPLHTRLTDLETRSLTSTLADPISPRPITGWARVDAELAELRRHFQIARTDQDYRNVGNDCVIVIEALSAHVYDPKIHLADGDEEPPVAMTKVRIERFIEVASPGPDNAELRTHLGHRRDRLRALTAVGGIRWFTVVDIADCVSVGR